MNRLEDVTMGVEREPTRWEYQVGKRETHSGTRRKRDSWAQDQSIKESPIRAEAIETQQELVTRRVPSRDASIQEESRVLDE